MHSPGPEFDGSIRRHMLPGLVSFTMGRSARKHNIDVEVAANRSLASPNVGTPPETASTLGLNAEPSSVGVEALLGDLPPSREQFEEMLSRGDATAVIDALDSAVSSFKARSLAATDEAIRDLRESGVPEEDIEAALEGDGWVLGPHGAHPKNDPPKEKVVYRESDSAKRPDVEQFHNHRLK